jgi:putative CocE/NonD family hydrolase
LKAIFPVVSGYDEYFDRFYSRGGAVKFGHRLLWISENVRAPGYQPPSFSTIVRHLPIRTADRVAAGQRVGFWQRILDHPTYDAFWRSISTRAHIEKVRVPAFIITGWYDNFAESDLEAFAALSARAGGHRIVVGPWGHNMSIPFEGEPFGRNTGAPVRRYQIDWFNYWMKTPQPAREFEHPPVRIFIMGLNKWRDEREWPLLRAKPTPFYLVNEGGLTSRPGRGGRDQFTYDPRRPVPTMGGAICCNPKVFPWGPMDQQGVEARDDVLVYSTAPLVSDVEVTGPVRVVLHVSTSAPDTDFTAKLVDVFPDGYARNLCDGILRLRYRNGLESAKLARPGEVYAITIQAGVTSNLFRAGHRIRLEISSSNFPRFDRNPNTGTLVADERLSKTARQTVYYGGSHASHVLLPIVPVK